MIRDSKYTQHLREISALAEKLDNTLDSLPGNGSEETMEETEIRHALYRAAEKLNDAKGAIVHFSKNANEGILKENNSGKFEVQYNNGGSSYPLSCGSSLEVYLEEDSEQEIEAGWYAGRVEHSDRYYFYGPGKPFLCDGMKARLRGNQ